MSEDVALRRKVLDGHVRYYKVSIWYESDDEEIRHDVIVLAPSVFNAVELAFDLFRKNPPCEKYLIDRYTARELRTKTRELVRKLLSR